LAQLVTVYLTLSIACGPQNYVLPTERWRKLTIFWNKFVQFNFELGAALFNILKHQTNALNNPFGTPTVANLDTLLQPIHLATPAIYRKGLGHVN